MPDPTRLQATIRRAIALLKSTPGRAGSLIDLPQSASDVVVVGDLHGHIHNFAAALKFADLPNHPQRHLILQELIHDPRIDPDEEVDLSHRLLDLACALKSQYGDRVHIIMGNHELSELTDRSISKNGVPLNALFRKGIEKSYGEKAPEFVELYKELFAALPLAVRTANRVLICHTLPDGRYLDDFDLETLRRHELPPESLRRGGLAYSLTWGRDTSQDTADRFAKLMDSDWIITGHHPCDAGYFQASQRHLILDGTDPYPACCLFQCQEPITFQAVLDGVRLLGQPDIDRG